MKLNTAIFLSVIVHVGLIALLMSNFQFSKVEIKQSGAPIAKINAKAVNSKRVEKLVEKLKKDRQQKTTNEKKRLEDLKKAETESRRKRQEEERKAEDAKKKRQQAEQTRKNEEKKTADLKRKRIKEEQERKKKTEQEKIRKEKIKKEKEAAERKSKAEAERKRKQREDAERKRKAKAEAERKRKEAEEKARQEAIEQEMMEQMAAEEAELQAAHHQQVMSEADKFNNLIQGKIKRNWFSPEQPGSCTFRIKISQGGLVIGIEVLAGDSPHCDSGRRAIRRAEPLPMSKDPDVFEVLKNRTFKLSNEENEESL